MRTIIDLPEDLRRSTDAARAVAGISRAELIRRALRHYLQQAPERPGRSDVFGLWQARGIEGIDYQERRRGEWDERP